VSHIVYHSIFWQYLPGATQKACASAINTAGAAATPETPLAWFSIEADATKGSAAMRCTLWPGRHTYCLGRMDFHGRWVRWQPQRLTG